MDAPMPTRMTGLDVRFETCDLDFLAPQLTHIVSAVPHLEIGGCLDQGNLRKRQYRPEYRQTYFRWACRMADPTPVKASPMTDRTHSPSPRSSDSRSIDIRSTLLPSRSQRRLATMGVFSLSDPSQISISTSPSISRSSNLLTRIASSATPI